MDDAGKDVALRRDEGEGFVIGPNHGNAGGNRRSGRTFQVDDRHLARFNARPRAIEVAAFRPIGGEVGFPAPNDFARSGRGTNQAYAIGLVPKLAEAAIRPGQFFTAHIQINRVRWGVGVG